MRYLATANSPEIRAAIDTGELGMLTSPSGGRLPRPGCLYAIDNDAFGGRFDPTRWVRFLGACRAVTARCAFAAAPDVVADAAATLELADRWVPTIRAAGLPAALVAQDGLEVLDVPWHHVDVLFIGGSTAWKLGPHARDLAAQARDRAVPVHVGRVNSERRIIYAAAAPPYGLGATWCDGTYLALGPRKNLPRLRRFLRALDQHPLEFGEPPAPSTSTA